MSQGQAGDLGSAVIVEPNGAVLGFDEWEEAPVDCAHFIALETRGVSRDPPGTAHHLLQPTCTSARKSFRFGEVHVLLAHKPVFPFSNPSARDSRLLQAWG